MNIQPFTPKKSESPFKRMKSRSDSKKFAESFARLGELLPGAVPEKATIGGIQFTDPDALKRERESKAMEQMNKTSIESSQDLGRLLNLSDNLISAIKGANIEQGGGGPVRGTIGNIAARLGQKHTGLISGMKATKRETALAYTRVLAGGARGVATLFHAVLDSMPDNKFTSEQAASTIAEINLAAYAFKKGADEFGYDESNLKDVTPQQADEILKKGRGLVTEEETKMIYQGLSDKFKSISPRMEISLEGGMQQPELNPISKFIYKSVPESMGMNSWVEGEEDPFAKYYSKPKV